MGWWKSSKKEGNTDSSSLEDSNLFTKDDTIALINEFSPQTYEEVEVIANALVSRKAIKLNLQNTIIGDRRRIIDFLCGIAYVLDLDVKKLAVDLYEFKNNK